MCLCEIMSIFVGFSRYVFLFVLGVFFVGGSVGRSGDIGGRFRR